jgi:hypothetical protein
MSPVIIWVSAIAALLFLVLFLVAFARRMERERTEALRRLAETAGLEFQPTPEVSVVRALGDVQLFDRGHSKRVRNLMTGRLDGQHLAVFDYRYTTGSGKHQHTHSQTVVLLPRAKMSLPDMQLAPENALVRIAEVFGYQDIDLESSPEFSRRYIVRGADEAAIRAALYPGAASYFAQHEGWTLELKSGGVAIYRANRRAKPEDMRMFIEDALAAARSL